MKGFYDTTKKNIPHKIHSWEINLSYARRRRTIIFYYVAEKIHVFDARVHL